MKNLLCPNFLVLPKKSELPKIWGGCSPPPPPDPYAYAPYIYPGGFDEVEWDFNKSPRVLLIDFKQFMSWVCCLKVMRNILVKAQKYYSGQDSLIEIFLVAFQNGCFPL